MKQPGSHHHQRVLRALDDHYRDDERILSLIVFGSVGRGDWHSLSDLDLDVIIADQFEVSPIQEVAQLTTALAAIGEEVLLRVPDGDDAVDIVLSSLMGMSIRYHHLSTTKSAIVDSMVILAGSLDSRTVRDAARQSTSVQSSADVVLDRCIRYLIETSHDVQRQRLWSALEGMHRARGLFMVLFAQHYGGVRSLQTFQKHADADLQSRLAETVPQASFASVLTALVRFLDLIESEADDPENEWLVATENLRRLLTVVKDKVARMSADNAL